MKKENNVRYSEKVRRNNNDWDLYRDRNCILDLYDENASDSKSPGYRKGERLRESVQDTICGRISFLWLKGLELALFNTFGYLPVYARLTINKKFAKAPELR